VVDTSDALLEMVSAFSDAGEPCLIKPCVGNGSRGIRVISRDVDRFQLLFEHKPNSLFMSPEELELVVRNRDIPRMVVSEYLPGDEVTVDTLNNHGTVELLLVRKRTKMSGGISVSGEFIQNDQIAKSVQEISAAIPGLNGPIGFQLKRDKNDFYHLIESNPRIQGTSVAAAGLGINLPKLAVDMAIGRPLKISKKRDKVAFSRYYEEVFRDC
jgi:carbamoyl-phosphate synthase large subunit